jgi:carboxylate-amine ligase
VAAVVHALVADLAGRHAAGLLPPPAHGWRIAENRWSACRHGLGGHMADLATGGREPTARRVGRLLDEVAGAARGLGCDAELGDARRLLESGGDAARQRAVGAERGPRGLTAWLADRFLGDEPPPPPRPPLVASGGSPRAPRSRPR